MSSSEIDELKRYIGQLVGVESVAIDLLYSSELFERTTMIATIIFDDGSTAQPEVMKPDGDYRDNPQDLAMVMSDHVVELINERLEMRIRMDEVNLKDMPGKTIKSYTMAVYEGLSMMIITFTDNTFVAIDFDTHFNVLRQGKLSPLKFGDQKLVDLELFTTTGMELMRRNEEEAENKRSQEEELALYLQIKEKYNLP